MKTTLYNTVRFTGKLLEVSAHTDQSISINQCTWKNRGDGYWQGTLYQSRESWIDVYIPADYFEEHKDELYGGPGLWYHAFGTLETEVSRGTGIVRRFIKVTDIQVAESYDVD